MMDVEDLESAPLLTSETLGDEGSLSPRSAG
jgi:hypothetical protein